MTGSRQGSAVAARYIPEPVGFPLHRIRLAGASDEELATISTEMSIGLSVKEMRVVQEHFRTKGRDPTDVEVEALGQAWSEHCCYKSSKPVLKRHVFGIAENKVFAREDAGIVEFDEEHFLAAKMESHNHPSAIEPYGGAATGVGGIIRDVTCMGAQPIGLVDALFFGPLDLPTADLPKGTKHPRFLLRGVVEGIRDYGNRIGIPTVAGMVAFHEGYVTNCLVNVGCVGILKKSNYTPSKVKAPGDIYVYVGGATGRDGIHGVTFASAELREASEEASRSAVQVGDPILKEPLIHACLEVVERGLAQGMKDFGGGGLSCVVSEMAHDAGLGAEVEISKIPLKHAAMAPWEIWVSESQERMMVAVKPQHLAEVLHIFQKWDVPAVAIGQATKESFVRVLYQGKQVLEMDLAFQTGGPVYERPRAPWPSPNEEPITFAQPEDLSLTLRDLLAWPTIASKAWVIRQYDHEVRASTALKPLQGAVGFESPGDASVLKPLRNSWRGIALTTDVNPRLTERHPYWGACSAMDEVVRNLAAVGARLSFVSDNLNFGNPEDPVVMTQLEEACRGMGDMARALDVPFASGNVSLYNEGVLGPIPPTPTLMGLGIVADVRKCTTVDLKEAGSLLYLVGARTERELGGSAYLAVLGQEDGERVPRVEKEFTARAGEAVVGAAEAGLSRSCHDLSEGGLGVALCEMGFGGNLGATIDIDGVASGLRPDHALFSETNTRFLIEVAPENAPAFEKHFEAADVATLRIGTVGGKSFVVKSKRRNLVDLSLAEARAAWDGTLHRYMG